MQRNCTSSLFQTQSGTDASKSPLNSKGLLPPPPTAPNRGIGVDPQQDHLWVQTELRNREGEERGVDDSGFYGLPRRCILPKTKPMMKIPEKASTSVPAQSQRWRRPGSTTESLSCSGFHISGNCVLPRPSGSCGPTAAPLLAEFSSHYCPGEQKLFPRLSPPPYISVLLWTNCS